MKPPTATATKAQKIMLPTRVIITRGPSMIAQSTSLASLLPRAALQCGWRRLHRADDG